MTALTDIRHEGFAYRYCWMRCGAGDGSYPPVVFLSGAFQSMASWRRFVDAFCPRSDVLLVDLPGSGTADALPPEYGLDFLADALRAVLGENRGMVILGLGDVGQRQHKAARGRERAPVRIG